MYEFYDFFHKSGIALFFGGMIVSLKWLFIAEQRGREIAMRVAVKRTRQINTFVTALGIIIIALSGFLRAPYGGSFFLQSWLIAGLALFVLSVLLWLGFFIPAHTKLLRIITTSGESLPPDFFATVHRLYFCGALIIILPLGTAALMILKPHLW